MLHLAPEQTANRHQHSEPITVVTPLQYAGCGLNIDVALTHIQAAIRESILSSASHQLNTTVHDYAAVALKGGLGISAIEQYSQLSPSERTLHYASTMTALHNEFAQLCEMAGMEECDTWDVAFESGNTHMELAHWFGYGVLLDEYENHPLHYFIAAFANILADDFGAMTHENVVEYAHGYWGDYIEILDNEKFIQQYHNIYGDIEMMIDDDDLSEDDIPDIINESYSGIIEIAEFYSIQTVEACYHSLLNELSTAPKFKNTKELLPVVLETVETWQMWSDPIATQLVNDIVEYQQNLEDYAISGIERDDNSAEWQHIVLLSITEKHVPDTLYVAANNMCQDAYNHGEPLRYRINVSEPNWIQDLEYFAAFSVLIQRYFYIFWQ